MTLFIIALQAEAQLLIDTYALSYHDKRPYPTFVGDDVAIILSGVGMLRAAAATAYGIMRFSPEKIVNFGSCGAVSDRYPIGACFQIERIVDRCNDKSFALSSAKRYTAKAKLFTVSKPLSQKSLENKMGLVDMEAAGFYTAASRFLDKERIFVFKVVSDYLEERRLTAIAHAKLQQKHLALLQKVISDQF